MNAPQQGANPMMKKSGKPGRLRRVTIKHMYDQKGMPSGHTVMAEHEPDSDDMGPGSYSPPIETETPHETHDSAMAKVMEHHAENVKRFGKGKKKQEAPEEMRKALGR